jgi:amino acid adenylation domain-containing protein
MTPSCIHELFAEHAASTPDAVAVASQQGQLTYRELDERANRLARRLVGLGVGRDVPVALLMERSAHVIVSMLATIKAGGCYLALHDSYPPERMQWITDHAGRPVLLADDAMARRGLPDAGPLIVVDTDDETERLPSTDPGVSTSPDQLAYVIHTSGSTGHPKGIAITHHNAVSMLLDPMWDTGHHRRVLMAAPYSFGLSTYEVWEPLVHGGQVVVAPHGTPDVETLRRLISRHEVTGLQLAAGLFRVVAEEDPTCLAGVREIITGGDIISPSAVRRVLEMCPGIVVRPMFGSAELTTLATGVPLTPAFRPGGSVPVGRPLTGTRVYILDENLQKVSDGVAGEMYVAGTGVARGYLARPDLTAERFVPDPFHGDGQRMFRTGDIARWTEDGLIDFLGRADDQVKIRGFRVELAEVEAALARHPAVAHAVVVAREAEPGDKRLIAYLVPKHGECDFSRLRAHAAAVLPDYMVPSGFVLVPELPLTPNGKIDRTRLPESTPQDAVTRRDPGTDVERALCAIFADVLGVTQVWMDDDFLDLGGDSLLAVRLVDRVKKALGIVLTVETVFDRASVAGLMEHIGQPAGQSA